MYFWALLLLKPCQAASQPHFCKNVSTKIQSLVFKLRYEIIFIRNFFIKHIWNHTSSLKSGRHWVWIDFYWKLTTKYSIGLRNSDKQIKVIVLKKLEKNTSHFTPTSYNFHKGLQIIAIQKDYKRSSTQLWIKLYCSLIVS